MLTSNQNHGRRPHLGPARPIARSIARSTVARSTVAWLAMSVLTVAVAQSPGSDMDLEMDHKEAMNSNSDGYSGSGDRGQPGYTSDAVQAYAGGLIELASSIDLTPLITAPPTNVVAESGPALARDSEQAFAAGHLGMAVELMCGHMVAEFDEATPVIASVKFSPALRRPVWNVRWGVSIAVRTNDGVSDPSPIRDGDTTPGRPMAMSRGGYDDDMAAAEMAMQGKSMNDVGMDEMSMSESMSTSMSGPKSSTVSPRSMLSEQASQLMDENLGLVAEIIAKEFQQRFASGAYGPLFVGNPKPEAMAKSDSMAKSDAMAKSDEMAGKASDMHSMTGAIASGGSIIVSETLDALLNDAPEWSGMWKPGLVFVGAGPSDEMIAAAKSDGIDFLLHFDVLLKLGRNQTTQNVSRCRLFSPETGKQLGISRSFDNTEAASLVSTGRASSETAYVKEQLTGLLGLIDRDTKVREMPAGLTAEAARGRVGSLVTNPSAQSLQTLAEIRLYQSLGLLTADDIEAAFDIVGGSEAMVLLHGPRSERLEMARTWAVRAQRGAKK